MSSPMEKGSERPERHWRSRNLEGLGGKGCLTVEGLLQKQAGLANPPSCYLLADPYQRPAGKGLWESPPGKQQWSSKGRMGWVGPTDIDFPLWRTLTGLAKPGPTEVPSLRPS